MRFLRLFPQFRALEAELADAAGRAILAEDDTRLWRSRCDTAEEQSAHSREELSRSLKCVANYEAQRSGSPVVPFPEVFNPPALATENGEEVAMPRRKLAREAQAEQLAKTRKEAVERSRKNRAGE